MKANDPIVLAEHTCSSDGFTFGQVAPDYFNRPKVSATSEEVPF
jgi:hypothetical protein